MSLMFAGSLRSFVIWDTTCAQNLKRRKNNIRGSKNGSTWHNSLSRNLFLDMFHLFKFIHAMCHLKRHSVGFGEREEKTLEEMLEKISSTRVWTRDRNDKQFGYADSWFNNLDSLVSHLLARFEFNLRSRRRIRCFLLGFPPNADGKEANL